MSEITDSQGKRFKPLKKDQIGKYDKAAQDANNELTRLTVRTLLHTGLRNGTLCHLQPGWIENERILGKPMIRVPPRERCLSGAGATGVGNEEGANLHDRGEPCYNCRIEYGGHWEPKTRNAPRPLPVMEEEIHSSLKRWLESHEQIPLLHHAVATRVQRVAEQAGLDREVKPHDLRHTYGTMLARMGLKLPVIAAVMGHGSTNQSMRYITFVGRDIMEEFKENWDFDEYL